MWSVKSIAHAGGLTLLSGIAWYYVLFVPNKVEKLQNANIIRETISNQVNSIRLFKAVEKDKKLKGQYEIRNDFNGCNSNCTTEL